MKTNWIKMYDKHGCVLRVETVINDPYEFKVRRRAGRRGHRTLGWRVVAARFQGRRRAQSSPARLGRSVKRQRSRPSGSRSGPLHSRSKCAFRVSKISCSSARWTLATFHVG